MSPAMEKVGQYRRTKAEAELRKSLKKRKSIAPKMKTMPITPKTKGTMKTMPRKIKVLRNKKGQVLITNTR